MASNTQAPQAPQAPQAQVFCTICGKPVKNGTCGQLCTKKAAAGFTAQVKLAQKQALSLPQAPQGWVSIAQVHKTCVANLVPVAHLVKATGGDGVLYQPLHNIATPCYVNGTRYVHGWLNTKAGMVALATYNFTGAPTQAIMQWHAPKVK
jgi:hypothetical protein